ncbi:MAG TPA: HlyC/CorC family transporter [Candidatus Fimisoma avicola]|uniref:HlyC/CorC family transporter n=1 Tax=Candidatus Fimisoma avicola TaxID=2840826 RepID=A0A9D1I5Z4_9FIRM|nr:HlyC/CorC family transporter [Candidatus Fimisoma avicola]
MLLMIGIYGFFTAMNAAWNYSGNITEKIRSANSLIALAAASFAAWLSFISWELTLAFILCLIVLGQYVPYKIGIQHDDAIAEKTEKFITFISKLLSPVTAVLIAISNVFLKIFRQKTDVDEEVYTEEDVMSMLEAGKESGVFNEEGTKMISSIFAFDDKLAYEVMTPRTDVFMIDVEDPPEVYMKDLMKLRYSRVPVCKGDTDNIIGILHIKDYLIKMMESKDESPAIEPILRKAYFVPDTKKIDSLFLEMQSSRQQIAVLIDEYGGFSGIVTMEDMIEQIMGDIDDEYDEEEEIIDKIDDNTYLVDGDVDLDDLNDELGTSIESESSETIGGFLVDLLGEIPEESDVGKEIEYDNFKFKIMAVSERRIERVKMYIFDKK